MLRQKWNRRLSFEQLDNRIALNSDMQPSVSVGTTSSLSREFGQQLETRSRSVSTILVLQLVSQRTLFFSPTHHPNAMESRPEGEARSDVIFAPPTSASLKTSIDLTKLIQGIAQSESESNHFRIQGTQQVSPIILRILTPIAVQTVQREITQPSIAVAVASNSLSSNSPINAAPRSFGGPVPFAATSSTIAGSTFQLASNSLTTSNQTTVLNSSLNSEKPYIARALTQPSRLSHDSTAKSDASAFTANGMLSFSLREANDRSTGLGCPSSPNQRTGSEYSRNSRMNVTTASGLNAEMVAYSNRLPTPNGMIEIRENDSERPERMKNKMVSKAGSNPFEILQWFVGSTNMVQTGKTRSSLTSPSVTIDNDVEQVGSAKLTTKQESLLALATGALFVVALRLKHLRYANQDKMPVSQNENKQNSRRNGLSLNPCDSVRRLVKQFVHRLP